MKAENGRTKAKGGVVVAKSSALAAPGQAPRC